MLLPIERRTAHGRAGASTVLFGIIIHHAPAPTSRRTDTLWHLSQKTPNSRGRSVCTHRGRRQAAWAVARPYNERHLASSLGLMHAHAQPLATREAGLRVRALGCTCVRSGRPHRRGHLRISLSRAHAAGRQPKRRAPGPLFLVHDGSAAPPKARLARASCEFQLQLHARLPVLRISLGAYKLVVIDLDGEEPVVFLLVVRQQFDDALHTAVVDQIALRCVLVGWHALGKVGAGGGTGGGAGGR